MSYLLVTVHAPVGLFNPALPPGEKFAVNAPRGTLTFADSQYGSAVLTQLVPFGSQFQTNVRTGFPPVQFVKQTLHHGTLDGAAIFQRYYSPFDIGSNPILAVLFQNFRAVWKFDFGRRAK